MSRPLSPPAGRSYLWRQVNAGADQHRLRLQVCADCETVHYPPQELCHQCLGHRLNWETLNNTGTVLSWTRLYASAHDFFKPHLPIYVGYIRLDVGVAIFSHLTAASAKTGTAVKVLSRRDKSGQAAFFAVPFDDDCIVEFKDIMQE